jgi:hypothetical protein
VQVILRFLPLFFLLEAVVVVPLVQVALQVPVELLSPILA